MAVTRFKPIITGLIAILTLKYFVCYQRTSMSLELLPDN